MSTETSKDSLNPFIDNFPGPLKLRFLERVGTDQEKLWITEAKEARMTETEKQQREAGKAYERTIMEKPVDVLSPQQQADNKLFTAKQLLLRKMSQGRPGFAPENNQSPEVLYQVSRSLLWAAYCQQVEFETGRFPDSAKLHPSLLSALAVTAHWLAGLNEWQSETIIGQCVNPRQSLYFVGDVGVGKSTLAVAAHYASAQLHHKYGTELKLGLISLDELVMDIYSSSDMARVAEACKGHMVLDELRLKHVGYQHYGNKVSLLADIFLNRHHGWKQRGEQTIITTNVPPAILMAEMDDDRINDRLIQQYAMIEIKGHSYRRS